MTRSRGVLLASAALSGLLVAASFPPVDMSWLAWVAWAPWLACLCRTQPPGTAGLAPSLDGPARGAGGCSLGEGALAGAVHLAALHVPQSWWMIVVMRVHGGLSLGTAIAMYAVGYVILAPWGILAGMLGAALGRRGAWGLLALPWAWALLDIVRTHFALGFPWLIPGMTQAGHPSVMGFADVAGVHGLGAVVLLANAALAILGLMVWRRQADRRAVGAAAVAGVLVVLALAHGVEAALRFDRKAAWAMSVEGVTSETGRPDWPVRGVRVAVVQGAQPQQVKIRSSAEDARDLARVQIALTDRALGLGARAIIWAESSHPSTTARMPWLLATVREQLQAAASAGPPADHDVPPVVIAGAVVESPGAGGEGVRFFNSALLVGPDGVGDRYDKRRLVPFGEYLPMPSVLGRLPQVVQAVGDFEPGASDAPLVGGGARWGLSVCYEIVLSPRVLAVTRGGADILVNITNDGWYHGTWMPEQHLRFAAMRAVEMRLPVVRAANSGISAVIAPSGRIVARMEEGHRGLLLAAVHPEDEPSPFSRWGDAPVAAAGVLAVLWAAWRRGRRSAAVVASSPDVDSEASRTEES